MVIMGGSLLLPHYLNFPKEELERLSIQPIQNKENGEVGEVKRESNFEIDFSKSGIKEILENE